MHLVIAHKKIPIEIPFYSINQVIFVFNYKVIPIRYNEENRVAEIIMPCIRGNSGNNNFSYTLLKGYETDVPNIENYTGNIEKITIKEFDYDIFNTILDKSNNNLVDIYSLTQLGNAHAQAFSYVIEQANKIKSFNDIFDGVANASTIKDGYSVDDIKNFFNVYDYAKSMIMMHLDDLFKYYSLKPHLRRNEQRYSMGLKKAYKLRHEITRSKWSIDLLLLDSMKELTENPEFYTTNKWHDLIKTLSNYGLTLTGLD